MKAAVLYGSKALRLEDRKLPNIRETEILVKVKSAALCGTDLRMWTNGIAGNLPRVLGHEVSGIIHAVGSQVTGYRVGDRVAIAPNMGCGLCDRCISGNSHMCPDYKALGIHLDGAFEEYMVIPESAVRQGNVCKLEDKISFGAAAALEALSCVYNGFEHYQVHPGDAVLIIGSGPIGAMHAMLALMAGASQVIVNDLSADRLAHLSKLLPEIIPYSGSDLKSFIMDRTQGRGLDVCVTACPSPSAQSSCFEVMALNGRVCFFGGLPVGRELVPLNTNLIHYKQLLVTGTTRASLSQYRKCLHLVGSGVLNLDRLITHRYSIDQIGEAFERTAHAEGLKSVIEF